MAEGLGSALQKRVQRFKSVYHLQFSGLQTLLFSDSSLLIVGHAKKCGPRLSSPSKKKAPLF